MRKSVFAGVVLMVMAVASASSAEVIIKNDNAGDTVNGLVGSAAIIQGEGYEAIFDIPPEYLPENSGKPLELLGVQVLMVNGDGKEPLTQTPVANPNYCGRFNITVWEEPAGVPTPSGEATCFLPDFSRPRIKAPGAQIFDFETAANGLGFEVQGQPNMGQVSLTDMRFAVANMNPQVTLNPVYIDKPVIRVRIQALDFGCTTTGNLYPVMVADLDGAQPGKNYIYGGLYDPTFTMSYLCAIDHYLWEDFGPGFANAMAGDWVIRLILDAGGNTNPGGDMGSDMGSDMGNDLGSDMGDDPMDMGSDMVAEDMGSNDTGSGGEDMGGQPGVLAVSSISPGSGDNDGSTDIVILGTGFEVGLEVLLGATAIGVTETRGERIKATVPDGLDPGVYDLIVTNPDDATASLADAFEVTDPMGDLSGGNGDNGCGCDTSSASTTSLGATLIMIFLGLGLLGFRRRESAKSRRS